MRRRYDAPVTQKKLAVIGGDGIGPEVVAEGLKVLEAVAGPDAFETTPYDLGAAHWQRTGEVLSDETMAELATADVILLGAVGASPGAKDVPSGLLERGLLLKLRFAFDHYVNLRPSRLFPGRADAAGRRRSSAGREVDFVVVREGTEGLYCGNGGTFRGGTPHEIGTEVSINTAYGVERVVRDAFERATRRRNKLTLVHKHNVLVYAGGLWRRIFETVAAEYPQVSTDYLHVDAATIFLATDPARFDVIVTDNLFGDILTDLAAAVTGGIGLAASGNINPTRRLPVDVRAGARLRAGHRRAGRGRPDRDDPLGGAAARARGSPGRGGARGEGRAGRHHGAHAGDEAVDLRDRRRDRRQGLPRRSEPASADRRRSRSSSARVGDAAPATAGQAVGTRTVRDARGYEDDGDDRVVLAGATPGLAGGVVVAVFGDVPRVRIHLVHAVSCARRGVLLAEILGHPTIGRPGISRGFPHDGRGVHGRAARAHTAGMSAPPELPELVLRALRMSLQRGYVQASRTETGRLLATLAATRTGTIAECGTGCGVGRGLAAQRRAEDAPG